MKTIVKIFIFALSLNATAAFAQDPYQVSVTFVQDQKAVFATVESVDVVAARARIGGTVTELLVDEGSAVREGQKLARVVDDKVALKLKSVDEQIQSLISQLDLDQTELKRSEQLFQSGTIPKARLDAVRTKREVSARALSSAKAERQVLEQTRTEGDVLAPSSGRILKVNVRKGSVVLPGEAIANMAAEAYILRLQLPERHAMFINEGDQVRVAERGLGALKPDSSKDLQSGVIRQVYPEIKQGRVSADVEVPDLGDFFVGERIRVWIGTGNRPATVVPEDYLFTRYGLTYVKLSDGREVVVQPGLPQNGGVEVLTGLKAGDALVKP